MHLADSMKPGAESASSDGVDAEEVIIAKII